jgi:hypothetical protein
MSGNGLSQAVPPVYAEFIARQFLDHSARTSGAE